MQDVYLPSAETWVWEQDGSKPYGFISVMQSQFVGVPFSHWRTSAKASDALLNHVQLSLPA